MKTQIHKLAVIIIFTLFIQTCFSQTREKINLVSNGNSLNSYFYQGTSGEPTVILLHGLPGNDDNPLNLAENLNNLGYNILVFNYQGTYSSEGYFSYFNSMNDLDAAINWLKEPEHMLKYKIDTSRIIVCGYSFGGSVVMTRALVNRSIKYIVNIAGPDQSVMLARFAADSLLQGRFENAISNYYVPAGPLKSNPEQSFHQQVTDLISRKDEFDLVKNADRLKDRNILFIVAWMDQLSTLEENALPLYRKLAAQGAAGISIKAYEDGHQFRQFRPELAQTIAEWIQIHVK